MEFEKIQILPQLERINFHDGFERLNAADWPEEYECTFIEPGVCSYENVNQGMAFLKKENIDQWLQTFVGKPVTLQHAKVHPSNMEKFSRGYVTRVWFEPHDGWYHARFLVTEDEAKKALKDGYSVSCGYDIIDVGPGGEWHKVKYDGEILRGVYTHLAIVPNPRYEGCKVWPVS